MNFRHLLGCGNYRESVERGESEAAGETRQPD